MKKTILILIVVAIGSVLFTMHKKQQKEIRKERIKESIEQKVGDAIERNSKAIDAHKKKESKEDRSSRSESSSQSPIAFLQGYEKTANKVLLSADEKAERLKLLQDEALMRKGFLYLIKDKINEPKKHRIKNSMVVIDYLHEALNWEENPARDEAIVKTKYFLMNDILEQKIPQEQIRVSAVNKAELYLVLKKIAPEQAADVKRFAKGTKLMPVIQFAERNI